MGVRGDEGWDHERKGAWIGWEIESREGWERGRDGSASSR